MRTNPFYVAFFLFLSMPAFAQGSDMGSASMSKIEPLTVHEHGQQVYHSFRLETGYGGSNAGAVKDWDFNGWIGGDYNKLWLKSEGEDLDGETEKTEFWALCSRNIAEFWDLQAGIRHDTQPISTSYLVLGVNGLAPYFFETEAHLFISDEGDISARVHREHDLLLTQRLILQPYIEAGLSAQDVPEQDIGAGITAGEIGLQTRYEITRKFAPYIDLRYERKFGETSSIAKDQGEDNDNFSAVLGLRLMF